MPYHVDPAGILNAFEPQHGHATVAGERRLWRAILQRAFEDVEGMHLQGSAGERRTAQVSAAQWFLSDHEEPASFLWVCSQLGLDPGAIRRRLRELSRTADYKRAKTAVANSATATQTGPKGPI
jgi:hypothetical protein